MLLHVALHSAIMCMSVLCLACRHYSTHFYFIMAVLLCEYFVNFIFRLIPAGPTRGV